ncbi:MAG: diaminopimelate epimerase [Candidatus Omnitrophica bacterium]|nr:diaminopimelate epimerase [Candidatus Omnitrophota bacterium]
MDKVDFVKMVASGNDFVLIEGKRKKQQLANYSDLAKKICERKFGVGADGILIVDKSTVADFKMRIFNPDGSEAEMCGNGLRCVALFAKSKIKNYATKISREKSKNFRIETEAGILEATVEGDKVKIKMIEPKDLKMDISLYIGGEKYIVHYINTGVPHAILFVNDLKNTNVKGLGKIIRFHPRFLPQGTNVDFVEVKDRRNILLRTYERGVEDETLACGTGAVASAIISNLKLKKSRMEKNCEIKVLTQGGEILKVFFERKDDNFKNVWLEGNAKIVFKGVYYG